MIYTAQELLPYLTHLTLAGKDNEGNLEWIGIKKDWDNVNKILCL